MRVRRFIAPVALVAAALLAFAAPAVTQAAPYAPTAARADTSGITDPAVLEKIAEIEASGTEVLSVSDTVTFTPEVGDGAAARDLPAGCGLTVIVSKNGLVIDGGSITSCDAPFAEATMASTMTHYNPDWGVWDSTVAQGSDSLVTGHDHERRYRL